MNNNQSGFYILKIFTYILGIFQAALYTPIVLSIALFVVIIPRLFQGDLNNPLFRFLPNGHYTTTDILVIYGKYAFGLSLVIAFAEMMWKKRFTISIKKKIVLFGLLLLVGYSLTFIFFVTKTKLTIGDTLIVLVPSFILSFFAVCLSTLVSKFINFLNQIFANPTNLRS